MKKQANERNLRIFGAQVKAILTTLFLMANFLTSAVVDAQDERESIRIDTNLVLVNVLVRDKKGQFIRELRSDQFELFDNGKKRPIETFSKDAAPISFGIVYDMHPTNDDSTRSVIESLRRFKTALNPADDLFLVAFNMRGEQTFDFVPTFEQLQKHMTDPDKRDTYALYDAVYLASEHLRLSRNEKRVLLIISDSADHQSRHRLSEVREKVNDLRAEVFAIIFDGRNGYGYWDITHRGREHYPFSEDASPLDRAAVQDLTLKSGGGTYFGGAQNSERLFGIYSQIVEEMRSHYTLGFYPDLIDDKRRRLDVRLREVPGAKNLILTYPKSYRNRKRQDSK